MTTLKKKKHFQHKRDFQTCFDAKICLPAIETSIISGLDITVAAPQKSSFDSLDKRSAMKIVRYTEDLVI